MQDVDLYIFLDVSSTQTKGETSYGKDSPDVDRAAALAPALAQLHAFFAKTLPAKPRVRLQVTGISQSIR